MTGFYMITASVMKELNIGKCLSCDELAGAVYMEQVNQKHLAEFLVSWEFKRYYT